MEKINFDEFKKVEIAVGRILSAEKVPETDKLLKLSVDFAEENPRQIISGISMYFPECEVLVGRKCMFVVNLEPRNIKGLESQGMILAVSGENFFSLLSTNNEVPPGATVK